MWLEIAPRPPPEALNKYRRAYSQRNQEIEKGGEANTVNVFSHSIAECPDVRVSSFMLDHAFEFAVEQNKLSMVEVMLTTGKDLLRDINLIRFVKTQSMFKLLLAHGAEVCSNPAPLIHSVRNRDFEFTSLLLSSGYRPDMQLYSATETAVYWAARDDDADMLKKLAEYDGFEAAVTTWLGHEIDDECMCRYCLHELPITPVSAAAVLSRTTDCLEFLLDHNAWKHRQANGFEPYENDGSDHNVPCNMASNNLASDNNDSDNNDSDNNDSDNDDSDSND
ncbi:AvaB protein [Cordyceps fumosorosea ARSEF 2679]|uniref:AvaB protein n=1 Tax=Cordyceps fumosorosea (strain ARSEF 2679) TaxID=1081104 RepID=A0A167WNC3_CORFA|nr:AvaB protein [Cordyceps fumosorosea ARSEF 2679]OAA64006.1 AvaB protein [Cordyceps fumosorosea ARSEF 2679]